jgi:hypothetical protein
MRFSVSILSIDSAIRATGCLITEQGVSLKVKGELCVGVNSRVCGPVVVKETVVRRGQLSCAAVESSESGLMR